MTQVTPHKVGRSRVVSSAEASSLNPEDLDAELPPAGYSRTEELIKRKAELEAQIEALTNPSEGGVEHVAVDPSKVKPDNDILQYITNGSYPVKNADPIYEYVGVQRDQFGKYGGVHIMKKKVLGYEVCRYGDPEEWGVRSPEGYCIIGDVLLMRVRKDIHLKLHRQGQKIADMRRGAADHELRQVGEKARSKGIVVAVEGEVSDKAMQRMSNVAEAQRRAKALADTWIKEGRMPGVPSAEDLKQ